ncbi:IclR family transcriptional regulator [Acetobacteraceae bacterium H6797]|nr:IclR family transcriptional regulator [Acetobacteraceae bacterium H6797]
MSDPSSPARTVRAASRALDIIEAVAAARRIKHTQIATQLGIPKSTTTQLLETLVEAHYLRRDPESRTFSLGSRILGIAGRYLAEQDIVQVTQPILSRLVTELDESCFLVVGEEDEAVVLWREICQRRLTYTMALGERVGLTATASGLALLAFRDPATWPMVVSREIADPPARTAILAELPRVAAGALARREGYVEDVASLALPLFDHGGRAIAALSVALPTARLEAERLGQIEAALRAAQGEAAGRLGYRGPFRTAA